MRTSWRLGRWLVLAAVLVVTFVAASWIMSGSDEGSSSGERAERYLARPEELASVLSVPDAVLGMTNPPVDVDQLERSARSLTLNRVPLPDEHAVSTYRRADTDAEITQAVLVYEDREAAGSLDRLASSLLAGAFHLQTKPIAIEGAADARLWWSEEYLAISFRRDGVVVFIGDTDAGAEEDVRALAELALREIAASPPDTAAHPTASHASDE